MVKNQAVIGENAAMCKLDSVLSSILGNLLNASWAKWWHTTRVLLLHLEHRAANRELLSQISNMDF